MSNRTWLVASDIHGSKQLWQLILKEAESNREISSIILCGDLTNNGKRVNPLPGLGVVDGEFFTAGQFIKKLAAIRPVYWIPGNHDWDVVESDFSFQNVTNIDSRKVTIDGLSVYGVNQSPCFEAPALAIEWRNMSTDPEVDNAAYAFEKVDVVISHCPPEGVLDNIGAMHIGSPALDRYIHRYAPQYVFCGHVHEQGNRTDHLLGTKVINVAGTYGVFKL
jgi:Icc-related predicted phosphoesterase